MNFGMICLSKGFQLTHEYCDLFVLIKRKVLHSPLKFSIRTVKKSYIFSLHFHFFLFNFILLCSNKQIICLFLKLIVWYIFSESHGLPLKPFLHIHMHPTCSISIFVVYRCFIIVLTLSLTKEDSTILIKTYLLLGSARPIYNRLKLLDK